MSSLLTDFHFLRPAWLIAMIPLLLLIYFTVRAKRRQGQWHQVLPSHLANLLIDEGDGVKRQQSGLILSLCAVIASVALAGPTWERIEQPLFKVKQAQVIIADMSLSMYSTDLAPNRLTRAKFKIKDLIARLSEGETGLIAYAGDAFVISPMTQDVANLNNLLPALNPQIMPVYGSNPAIAIDRALELLNQTQYKQGQIYLVTDGLEPGDSLAITQQLKNTQFSLNILGVGTTKGAPIKLPNDQLLKDDNGNIVIPKLQPNILRNLANTLSGRYSNLTNDQSDIDFITGTVSPDDIDEQTQDKQFGDQWHEVGPYLVLLILPFALIAFRRGVLTGIIGLSIIMSYMPQPAFAKDAANNEQTTLPTNAEVSQKQKQDQQSTSENWLSTLFKSKNQRGFAAYQQQNYDKALTNFDDPQWRGASHYKQGNYEQALQAFEHDKKPKGLFNQANALAKMENYQDAIERLERLLEQEPQFPNAKENLEAIKEMLKQQEQQQQSQDGQQGDGEQQDSSQQESDSQQQDGQDGEDQQNQQQSGDNQSQESNPEKSPNKESQQNEQQSSQSSDKQQTTESKDAKEPTDEEKAQQAKAQQAAQQKQQLFNEENLTPEQLQRLNQLVKKIPDDPSLLLKNKMAVEARKRQYQRVTTKERKKW